MIKKTIVILTTFLFGIICYLIFSCVIGLIDGENTDYQFISLIICSIAAVALWKNSRGMRELFRKIVAEADKD
jgi:predicted anti-sigma-YlaC factor YlaD